MLLTRSKRVSFFQFNRENSSLRPQNDRWTVHNVALVTFEQSCCSHSGYAQVLRSLQQLMASPQVCRTVKKYTQRKKMTMTTTVVQWNGPCSWPLFSLIASCGSQSCHWLVEGCSGSFIIISVIFLPPAALSFPTAAFFSEKPSLNLSSQLMPPTDV